MMVMMVVKEADDWLPAGDSCKVPGCGMAESSATWRGRRLPSALGSLDVSGRCRVLAR
ncbi:hypothetical protein ACLOJK_023821 [Asimina triloba]